MRETQSCNNNGTKIVVSRSVRNRIVCSETYCVRQAKDTIECNCNSVSEVPTNSCWRNSLNGLIFFHLFETHTSKVYVD